MVAAAVRRRNIGRIIDITCLPPGDRSPCAVVAFREGGRYVNNRPDARVLKGLFSKVSGARD
jgi:hypothetical protein